MLKFLIGPYCPDLDLNVLVNNSGIAWGDDYDAYPDEGWDKCMNLNVQRVFTLTQKLTPLLRKAAEKDGNANIINVRVIPILDF